MAVEGWKLFLAVTVNMPPLLTSLTVEWRGAITGWWTLRGLILLEEQGEKSKEIKENKQSQEDVNKVVWSFRFSNPRLWIVSSEIWLREVWESFTVDIERRVDSACCHYLAGCLIALVPLSCWLLWHSTLNIEAVCISDTFICWTIRDHIQKIMFVNKWNRMK
jgi:hypothetical protein